MKPTLRYGYTVLVLAGMLTAGPAWGDADDRGLDEIVKDEDIPRQPLRFQVNYVYRPGGQGPLKPLTEGAVLHSDDHYKIQFTPQEDSYVYIFQLDSSETIYRLFPMEAFKGVQVNNHNPVKAGVSYTLPAPDKAFKLDEQRGPEVIYFMASRQPDEELENRYEAILQARRQQQMARANALQAQLTRSLTNRGLADIVPDESQATTVLPWAKGEIFNLPARQVKDLCPECVSVVTFEHR